MRAIQHYWHRILWRGNHKIIILIIQLTPLASLRPVTIDEFAKNVSLPQFGLLIRISVKLKAIMLEQTEVRQST
jgi:hypothetical protein